MNVVISIGRHLVGSSTFHPLPQQRQGRSEKKRNENYIFRPHQFSAFKRKKVTCNRIIIDAESMWRSLTAVDCCKALFILCDMFECHSDQIQVAKLSIPTSAAAVAAATIIRRMQSQQNCSSVRSLHSFTFPSIV